MEDQGSEPAFAVLALASGWAEGYLTDSEGNRIETPTEATPATDEGNH